MVGTFGFVVVADEEVAVHTGESRADNLHRMAEVELDADQMKVDCPFLQVAAKAWMLPHREKAREGEPAWAWPHSVPLLLASTPDHHGQNSDTTPERDQWLDWGFECCAEDDCSLRNHPGGVHIQ